MFVSGFVPGRRAKAGLDHLAYRGENALSLRAELGCRHVEPFHRSFFLFHRLKKNTY